MSKKNLDSRGNRVAGLPRKPLRHIGVTLRIPGPKVNMSGRLGSDPVLNDARTPRETDSAVGGDEAEAQDARSRLRVPPPRDKRERNDDPGQKRGCHRYSVIHPITRFPSIILIGGQSIILTTLNIVEEIAEDFLLLVGVDRASGDCLGPFFQLVAPRPHGFWQAEAQIGRRMTSGRKIGLTSSGTRQFLGSHRLRWERVETLSYQASPGLKPVSARFFDRNRFALMAKHFKNWV
jgi:hypothetical protein